MNISTMFLSLTPIEYTKLVGLIETISKSDSTIDAFFAEEAIELLRKGDFVTNRSWDGFKKEREIELAYLTQMERETEDWAEGNAFYHGYGC